MQTCEREFQTMEWSLSRGLNKTNVTNYHKKYEQFPQGIKQCQPRYIFVPYEKKSKKYFKIMFHGKLEINYDAIYFGGLHVSSIE